MEKFELCGVNFDRMDAREAAARIKKMLCQRKRACVFTPNFQMLRAAECENWEQLIRIIHPGYSILLIGQREIVLTPSKAN